MFGAIDDHDYGQNNGDVTYAHGKESNVAFVDFLYYSGGGAVVVVDEEEDDADDDRCRRCHRRRRRPHGRGLIHCGKEAQLWHMLSPPSPPSTS